MNILFWRGCVPGLSPTLRTLSPLTALWRHRPNRRSTVDQKRNLFRRITDRAVSAGFSGDDVMIALTENAPVDWSLGRGRAFGDQHAPKAASPASIR